MVIGKKIKLFISGTPPSIHFTPGVVYPPAKRGSGSSFHLGKMFMSGMHVYLVCVFSMVCILFLGVSAVGIPLHAVAFDVHRCDSALL